MIKALRRTTAALLLCATTLTGAHAQQADHGDHPCRQARRDL